VYFFPALKEPIVMDCDLDTLTRLLLDPCLTTGEAEREAAAVCGREFGLSWVAPAFLPVLSLGEMHGPECRRRDVAASPALTE
jgi:hypothetical protein